jgi:hypothetical protein
MALFQRNAAALPPGNDRADAVKAIVQESATKQLGRGEGRDHVEYKGHEFQVLPNWTEDPSDFRILRGDIVINRPHDDAGYPRPRYYRAVPVPSGTYTAILERQAAKVAAAEKRDRPRPVAVHGVFGIPEGTKELTFNMVRRVEGTPEEIAAAGAFGGITPGMAYLPPRPAPATAKETVSWWAKHGITFRTRPDQRLLVMANGGRLGRAQYDAIVADTRRIWLYLEGTDPVCEAHPERAPHPATRTVAIDVMACDE